METEGKSKISAVWNADNGKWVVLKNDPDEMITAPTILGLSKIIEGNEFFPVRVRYPGQVEMVDCIH
jgi:hypothetical protein